VSECVVIMEKDEADIHRLGTHVVKMIMEPHFDRGYGITIDNNFYQPRPRYKLLSRRTSVIRTVRLNSREIPVTNIYRLTIRRVTTVVRKFIHQLSVHTTRQQ